MNNWVKVVSLIILFILAGWIFPQTQSNIDIMHYDLSFDLYPDSSFLKGDAVITCLRLDKVLSEIDLNFYDNLKITGLTVNGLKTEYSNTDNLLRIKYEGIADTLKVEVIYEGTPKHVGLSGFVFGEINKTNVVYNLSEPDFASSWFPCKDVPTDKALLDIRITNDTSMISVSNGVLKDIKIEDGRKTYHWKTLYPIATYLVCLYSADYVTFSDQYISQDRQDTLPIQYYVFANQLEKARIDFEDSRIESFKKLPARFPSTTHTKRPRQQFTLPRIHMPSRWGG